MPLPQILFAEIPSNAGAAAALDRFLLTLRRADDSYGASEDLASRIALTLAVLQAHVEKGLPMDSPRLRGTVEWLRRQQLASPQILIAPLRLLAAAAVRTPAEKVSADIGNTLGVLGDLLAREECRKPILTLVCLEGLAAYEKQPSTQPERERVLSRVSKIALSATEPASVRSYAAEMLTRWGNAEQQQLALTCADEIVQTQSEGGWNACIVETAYTALNLAAIPAPDDRFAPVLARAGDFIQANCPGGIPELDCIKRVPRELGANEADLQAYAAAVGLRALLQVSGDYLHARLEFAHASWKLQIESEAQEGRQLLAEHESQAQLELTKKSRVIRDLSVLAGVAVVLLLLLVVLNPTGSTLILGAIGSIAGIIGFVKAYWPTNEPTDH